METININGIKTWSIYDRTVTPEDIKGSDELTEQVKAVHDRNTVHGSLAIMKPQLASILTEVLRLVQTRKVGRPTADRILGKINEAQVTVIALEQVMRPTDK